MDAKLPYDERRKTLLAFQRMMREKRGEMCAALKADLAQRSIPLTEATEADLVEDAAAWAQHFTVVFDVFGDKSSEKP